MGSVQRGAAGAPILDRTGAGDPGGQKARGVGRGFPPTIRIDEHQGGHVDGRQDRADVGFRVADQLRGQRRRCDGGPRETKEPVNLGPGDSPVRAGVDPRRRTPCPFHLLGHAVPMLDGRSPGRVLGDGAGRVPIDQDQRGHARGVRVYLRERRVPGGIARPDPGTRPTCLSAIDRSPGHRGYYIILDVRGIQFDRSDDFAFDRDTVTFRALLRTAGTRVLDGSNGAVKFYRNSAT